MEYLLYKKNYHIAPYFECLEDEYIDIYKHHFINSELNDNKYMVIGVIEYLKTGDTKFLDINKELVTNIFDYLGCDEEYILKILVSDNYQNTIYNNIINDFYKDDMKEYNQKLIINY